jgi:amino acid adenylation domain-containing protein
MVATILARFLNSAVQCPQRCAIEDLQGQQIYYAELRDRSLALASALNGWGIGPGDRVGWRMAKSIDGVVAILAILAAGAAYVPMSDADPPARIVELVRDSAVELVIVDRPREDLLAAWPEGLPRPALLRPDELLAMHPHEDRPLPSSPALGDLACILYTSGSTGEPKGVQILHENAASFVEWCHSLELGADDRFLAVAPFYFDLSILDLFFGFDLGATVVLVDRLSARFPRALAKAIDDHRITVIYATPTTLGLLLAHGRLDECDLSSLQTVLFAGEVFPTPQLARLTRRLPQARFFNLYGPTETNVCSSFRVPVPYPEHAPAPAIGTVCAQLEHRIVDEHDARVAPGNLGELLIAGPNVSPGYWGRPELEQRSWLELDGRRWYRTGDLVALDVDGLLHYHGRRDRMVKRRGYRIELGAIESTLERHPDIERCVCISATDAEGVRILAVVQPRVGSVLDPLDLRSHGVTRMPAWMLPDRFVLLDELPISSSGKVSYTQLHALLEGPT